MLKLVTKLVVKSKITLKCDRHPRFNPEEGRGTIKAECPACHSLLVVYNLRRNLLEATKNFEVFSKPYEAVKIVAPKKTVEVSLFPIQPFENLRTAARKE
jgi:hypothetical protein